MYLLGLLNHGAVQHTHWRTQSAASCNCKAHNVSNAFLHKLLYHCLGYACDPEGKAAVQSCVKAMQLTCQACCRCDMGSAAVSPGRHPVHHLWEPQGGQQSLQARLPLPGRHQPAPRARRRPCPCPPPCLRVSFPILLWYLQVSTSCFGKSSRHSDKHKKYRRCLPSRLSTLCQLLCVVLLVC